MKFHISSEILYEEIQGSVIVLDLRTEAYYILDPVATLLWRALLVTDNDDEVFQAVQNEYAVERARLQTDLEAFKRHCITRGFLQEKESSRIIEKPQYVEPAQPNFLVIRGWWCLFRTVRSLSTLGFARTYREYSCLPIPKQNSDSDRLVERSVDAFRVAENFFLIRNAPQDCLPRSLALFRFLRLAGLPVEHCIGVRRFPFAAHAWVEYRGHIVLDKPSQQSAFQLLARISA
jgi:hypothetical protein